MDKLNCYIYDDVSVATGIIEAKEWLGLCIKDKHSQSLFLTVFSELAQNINKYADRGKISLTITQNSHGEYLQVYSKDHGPGIADIENALCDNYSTSGSLGLGLPGIKRIMDHLEIESEEGCGVTITAEKSL
ncbi:ATP-binding protein [Lentisphaera profundi]|uniref:ATP-binding protein n=1 Tax=Lentisphaera profundi TaxID=1658616 RepID=A0ABY7VZ49_9BACT|nr:ATP-binding protein [Lentisphaera profundi]WDE98066.1 ATP-binding protein [Lentisphaera profundi]